MLAASPSPGERDEEMWVSWHTGSAVQGPNPRLSRQCVCLQTAATSSCARAPAPLGRVTAEGALSPPWPGGPRPSASRERERERERSFAPPGTVCRELANAAVRALRVGLVKAPTSVNQITAQMRGPRELLLAALWLGSWGSALRSVPLRAVV